MRERVQRTAAVAAAGGGGERDRPRRLARWARHRWRPRAASAAAPCRPVAAQHGAATSCCLAVASGKQHGGDGLVAAVVAAAAAARADRAPCGWRRAALAETCACDSCVN